MKRKRRNRKRCAECDALVEMELDEATVTWRPVPHNAGLGAGPDKWGKPCNCQSAKKVHPFL